MARHASCNIIIALVLFGALASCQARSWSGDARCVFLAFGSDMLADTGGTYAFFGTFITTIATNRVTCMDYSGVVCLPTCAWQWQDARALPPAGAQTPNAHK
jgi:hypothetical protein